MALRRVRGKGPNMTTIRHERFADVAAREAILDQAFGEERYRKSSERLREDRLAAEGLSFIATEDRGVIGAALVKRAVRDARKAGYAAILLVGDAPYYGRFGFSAMKTGALAMPGPFERDRLLALELHAGALDGANGVIAAAGRPQAQPDLALLVAKDGRAERPAA
jgi:predicted N-acetyltransferase YhbS